MPMLAGIDEAGYGPLLGPLCIACCALRCDDPAALDSCLRGLGVRDSKALYAGGRLAALEAVALPAIHWFTGWLPDTAADCFALLGDAPEQRGEDWQQGADELSLPVAADHLPGWELPAEALALSGRCCHPAAINACYRSGGNRAALEADQVAALLAALPAGDDRVVRIDRLGGRRYYGDLLACAFPLRPLEILAEERDVSSYRLADQGLEVHFTVKADRDHAICALASCIAKYCRELHMLLFNRYWCQRFRWLQATAGYPQDAKRWMHQLGRGLITAHAETLVRGDAERYMSI